MKKKLAIGVSIVLLLLGGLKLSEEVFGIDILPEMPAITPRQKQLEYLKEHEQDIIDFVKAQNPKIESVQIDWETMNVGAIGGNIVNMGYVLSVEGQFNGIEDSQFIVDFPLEKEGNIPDIKNIFMMNSLRILQNGVWDIYE